MTSLVTFQIREVDPQGPEALALLREAAREARALYPELHPTGAPWPTNPPNPPAGIYLVACVAGVPVASGALRPLSAAATELRRMFVHAGARRQGLATALLQALESAAVAGGHRVIRLETGWRQAPAMALYHACGYRRTAPFGAYVGDPTSVCFEKWL